MPTIDLVYDVECPNVAQARANLRRALARAKLPARWQEHRIGDHESPPRVLGFGSPTILVDGRDVAGEAPGAEACCRLYASNSGEGRAGRAPTVESITRALSAAAGERPARWRSTLGALPGLGVALLPKLTCPLCWPAYAAVLGALGIPFLMQAKWLLPLTAALLALGLFALGWRARSRRGYGPLCLAAGGALAILVGKFALAWNAVTYAGVAAFVAASLWNAWPRRSGGERCTACLPVAGASLREGEPS